MELKIREMLPEEADGIFTEAKKYFTFFEALSMGKPKKAFLAFGDGKLAGAVFLKTIPCENRPPIGYMDIIFVTETFRGTDTARRLFQAAAEYFETRTLLFRAGMVVDDNIPSWKLLQKDGFRQANPLQLIGEAGGRGAFRLWTQSNICFDPAYNMWKTGPPAENSSLSELFFFFLINLLCLLPMTAMFFLFSAESPLLVPAAGMLLLAGSAAGACGGVFASKRMWKFRLTHGGLLTSCLASLAGCFFPVMGRLYPEPWENTDSCRAALGICALTEWIAALLLTAAGVIFYNSGVFWQYVTLLGMAFVFWHTIPIFPFASFGGKRVLNWTRSAFIPAAILSWALCLAAAARHLGIPF